MKLKKGIWVVALCMSALGVLSVVLVIWSVTVDARDDAREIQKVHASIYGDNAYAQRRHKAKTANHGCAPGQIDALDELSDSVRLGMSIDTIAFNCGNATPGGTLEQVRDLQKQNFAQFASEPWEGGLAFCDNHSVETMEVRNRADVPSYLTRFICGRDDGFRTFTIALYEPSSGVVAQRVASGYVTAGR